MPRLKTCSGIGCKSGNLVQSFLRSFAREEYKDVTTDTDKWKLCIWDKIFLRRLKNKKKSHDVSNSLVEESRRAGRGVWRGGVRILFEHHLILTGSKQGFAVCVCVFCFNRLIFQTFLGVADFLFFSATHHRTDQSFKSLRLRFVSTRWRVWRAMSANSVSWWAVAKEKTVEESCHASVRGRRSRGVEVRSNQKRKTVTACNQNEIITLTKKII